MSRKLVLLILSFSYIYCDKFVPILHHLSYSKTHNFTVNSSIEYILQFYSNDSNPLHYPCRVTLSTENSTVKTPLMVVTRQPNQLLSWQLPLSVESESGRTLFGTTSRTLCHDVLNPKRKYDELDHRFYDPVVTVSTASPTNVTFNVRVDFQKDFYVAPSQQLNFTISPSEPKYFFYNFSNNNVSSVDSNYDTVILEVSSNDSVCMTVSIQNVSCPVLDLNQDITYRGFYETVNMKGGITIPKYKFPYGFFIVFVANGDDYQCTGEIGLAEKNRTKNISAIIKPSITYNDYVNAVVATLISIGGFYVVFGLAFFFYSAKTHVPRLMEYVPSTPTVESSSHGAIDNLSDEIDYDTLAEAESDREIRLGKSILYLSDLARKDPRIIKQKSYLYLYNVLTVALFYGLPVVQLVVTYQNVLNQTGEQDLCYYNFLCAHPLGLISDFNHLFSNIAYVMLGILFLIITFRRECEHKDLDFDRSYGIPQHYGMFYAMGVALIMEGILSGSYHVCPNKANFQFDSSFMYVMAVLCMVKLYQNRHPDINATAYSTFGVLAVAILLGMIGILEANLYFWVTFTVIYLLMCIYMSVKIYYLGCWRCDRNLLRRIFVIYTHDFISGPLNTLKPTYPARFVLLLLANLCNWALASYGVYQHQSGFGLYLLGIFMANTMLYFVFYIVMKYVHREKVKKVPWLFLTLSIMCAISAMYFFLHKSISWTKTPAQSRQYNKECALLRFYDYHDIWHFLSAIGMFFTFMVLLTLDDDLSHTHRSQIHVF